MSDIQDAAPSSTEPSAPVASVEEGKPIENGATIASMPSADTSIPSGSEISSAGDSGNVSSSDSTPLSDSVSAGVSTGTDSGNVVTVASGAMSGATVSDIALANSGNDLGNVVAAVEGGAPVTGVIAAVAGDAELAASHAEWTFVTNVVAAAGPVQIYEDSAIWNAVRDANQVHPASALADQISEHVAALEGSGDTFVSRVAADVKRLVDQIKAAL